MPLSHRHSGFTLIELSIVLVIIGLIIGGVLVGQDLIHAATIRAQINQFEKYNAAVNTFRGKYNGLPGDLNASAASQFGMMPRAGGFAHGDDNGLLASYESAEEGSAAAGENRLFWDDLSYAGLIEGSFNGPDCDRTQSDCASSAPTSIVPAAKIGRATVVGVYGDPADGTNYYQLWGDVNAIHGWGAYLSNSDTGVASDALTAEEASNIDTKIDDGLPLSGRVTSRSLVSLPGAGLDSFMAIPTISPPFSYLNYCVSANPGNPYNVDPLNGGTSRHCTIRVPIN